jgi:predicted Zn-dependent protease
MANQFSRFYNHEGYYNHFEENNSHPSASKRYADAIYRASNINKKKSPLRESEFRLIKIYIQFKEKSIHELLNSSFGKTLLLIHKNKISLATRKIKDMYEANPDSLIISYIYIKLLITSKQYDKALIIIDETNDIFQNNYPIMILHSKLYILKNQHRNAKKLLKRISWINANAPIPFYLYSKIAFKSDNPTLGHIMMGYYFFNIAQIKNSIEQFKIALRKTAKSDPKYYSLYNIYNSLVQVTIK